MIFMLIPIIVAIVLGILGKKYNDLEKSILDHIKLNHHKHYKELSVPLMGRSDSNFILGQRIIKKHKRLPKDPFLKEKYDLYRMQYKLFIVFAVIGLISVLALFFTGYGF